MGSIDVQRTNPAETGLWRAMAVALLVVVIAVFTAYYVFGLGDQRYSPGSPNATNAPATLVPATAPAVPTVHYP